jgi:putative ABC transport system permease protein
MNSLFISILTQTLTFIPLAFGIGISYTILRATDMTLEVSFVLGAAVFARLTSLGFSPAFAAITALCFGFGAGIIVALIQRGGKVDPLLAGILASFLLTSGNLILMGRPNISLLSQTTLLSGAFAHSDFYGWLLTALYSFVLCGLSIVLICTRFGLTLRALGDNSMLLQRLGASVEKYRMLGFAFTNGLAASAGILTAQTVGYADIGMGMGMTLTGIGAIIVGQQVMALFYKSKRNKTYFEFAACIIGVLVYFLAINVLLRLDVDPIYLKMLLGLILILFIRTAVRAKK